MQPVAVSSVENASQQVRSICFHGLPRLTNLLQPKKITDWIASINDLHRKKPPPNVKYTRGMPDIQTLMQGEPHTMLALLHLPFPYADEQCGLLTWRSVSQERRCPQPSWTWT
jgi:hypothetical protein